MEICNTPKFKICEKEGIDEIPYWPNLGPPQTQSNIHWSILARILYEKSLQKMEDLISESCAKNEFDPQNGQRFFGHPQKKVHPHSGCWLQ